MFNNRRADVSDGKACILFLGDFEWGEWRVFGGDIGEGG